MVSSLVLVHNCFLHGLQIKAAADNDKDSERTSACRAATYYPQLASRHEPPSARQRNAIWMAIRWWVDSGPVFCSLSGQRLPT